MIPAADQNFEIQKLKALLFQLETARLDALETNLASLQGYVGAADRLEEATADVLVAALARAEVSRPRELANAIAPSVVSAIRSEIKNSRELMVEALYPITGRMVSAAVANAFKELLAFLEQRLNALTSTELWIGRAKSLVTGRPISEFLLADSNPLRVDRLLFLERGSGRLVAEWRREDRPEENADLLAAMVAAILEFSVQALTEQGNLQKLDFGGRELVLRASPQFILAAECVGPLRPADDARINALFFDAIEGISRGARCDAGMLAALAASIGHGPRPPKAQSRRGKRILFAVAALIAAALAWLGYGFASRTMLEQRTETALKQLVEAQPVLAAFPLRLGFDHDGRVVSVSGIEPSGVDPAALVGKLAQAAAPYRVVDRIGILPGLEQPAALRSDVAALQQAVDRLQAGIDEARRGLAGEASFRDQQYARLDAQQTALRNETRSAVAEEARSRQAGLGERYAALRGEMRDALAQEAGIRERQAALQAERHDALRSLVDSPSERLHRFMERTAIFFGSGNRFADDEKAGQQIALLAELLANNNLKIRIVGHTDETGSEAVNKAIARRRAEQVMQKMVSLGIDRSRLVLVSRSASSPIVDGNDAGTEDNRRVTFENVFGAETAP